MSNGKGGGGECLLTIMENSLLLWHELSQCLGHQTSGMNIKTQIALV